MILSTATLTVLRNFANINPNLIIKPGKTIMTFASTRDVMGVYDGDDDFPKQVNIFNLPEFLAVISAFDKPEFDFEDTHCIVKQGQQRVKYVYAEPSLLSSPKGSPKMPDSDFDIILTAENLAKISKMSSVIGADLLSFEGKDGKIKAHVYNSKNPSANTFTIDLDSATADEFEVHFKIDRLKVINAEYTVNISKQKISKWSSANGLTYYIAIEDTSKM